MNKLILLSISISILLYSCGEDSSINPTENDNEQFQLSNEGLDFGQNTDMLTLSIDRTSEEAIDWELDFSNRVDWIGFSEVSGEDDGDISVYVDRYLMPLGYNETFFTIKSERNFGRSIIANRRDSIKDVTVTAINPVDYQSIVEEQLSNGIHALDNYIDSTKNVFISATITKNGLKLNTAMAFLSEGGTRFTDNSNGFEFWFKENKNQPIKRVNMVELELNEFSIPLSSDQTLSGSYYMPQGGVYNTPHDTQTEYRFNGDIEGTQIEEYLRGVEINLPTFTENVGSINITWGVTNFDQSTEYNTIVTAIATQKIGEMPTIISSAIPVPATDGEISLGSVLMEQFDFSQPITVDLIKLRYKTVGNNIFMNQYQIESILN